MQVLPTNIAAGSHIPENCDPQFIAQSCFLLTCRYQSGAHSQIDCVTWTTTHLPRFVIHSYFFNFITTLQVCSDYQLQS